MITIRDRYFFRIHKLLNRNIPLAKGVHSNMILPEAKQELKDQLEKRRKQNLPKPYRKVVTRWIRLQKDDKDYRDRLKKSLYLVYLYNSGFRYIKIEEYDNDSIYFRQYNFQESELDAALNEKPIKEVVFIKKIGLNKDSFSSWNINKIKTICRTCMKLNIISISKEWYNNPVAIKQKP